MDEELNAIKDILKGKSASMDGFFCDLYKNLWVVIGDDIRSTSCRWYGEHVNVCLIIIIPKKI